MYIGKLNPEIEHYLSECLIKEYPNFFSYEKQPNTLDVLNELVYERKIIWKEFICEHRWWTEWFQVVKFGDRYFGFVMAKATGDNSVYDIGWEFDMGSVVEVFPVEKVVIEYEPKK